jgi:hypothetical protein
MARRGKYGAEKRQKELRRKARREAKLERRHAKRESDAAAESPEVVPAAPAVDRPGAGTGD